MNPEPIAMPLPSPPSTHDGWVITRHFLCRADHDLLGHLYAAVDAHRPIAHDSLGLRIGVATGVMTDVEPDDLDQTVTYHPSATAAAAHGTSLQADKESI